MVKKINKISIQTDSIAWSDGISVSIKKSNRSEYINSGGAVIRKSILLFIMLSIPCLSLSQQKYWIFFKDKGYTRSEKILNIEKEKASFSERTLQRRAKTLSQDQLVDEDDLPLSKNYRE